MLIERPTPTRMATPNPSNTRAQTRAVAVSKPVKARALAVEEVTDDDVRLTFGGEPADVVVPGEEGALPVDVVVVGPLLVDDRVVVPVDDDVVLVEEGWVVVEGRVVVDDVPVVVLDVVSLGWVVVLDVGLVVVELVVVDDVPPVVVVGGVYPGQSTMLGTYPANPITREKPWRSAKRSPIWTLWPLGKFLATACRLTTMGLLPDWRRSVGPGLPTYLQTATLPIGTGVV